MGQDIFTKLDAKQAASVLRDVNPLCDGAAFDAASTTIMARPLAFFPGWRLLDIADFSLLPAARCEALQKNKAVILLDGSNAPIYRLARSLPIALDGERVIAYVRFFFQQVQVGGRRFLIAETVDDIAWLGEPPAPLRKEVGRRLLPLTARAEGNGWRVQATLLSGAALFAASIDVAADGVVGIAAHDVLVEELPVRDGVLDA